MKKIHRKIEQQRAKFVKNLAKQIRPIGNYFTPAERKNMNMLYHKCAITALQAKHEVSHLGVSKLNKLFHDLMKDSGIKCNPTGNCYNEKITMICFLKKVERESLEAKLQDMFRNSPEFKKN